MSKNSLDVQLVSSSDHYRKISRRFNAGFRLLQAKGLLDGNNALIKRFMIERYEEPLLTS